MLYKIRSEEELKKAIDLDLDD